MNILVNKELKEMFIKMSSNGDVRNIIKFYENNNLDKSDIDVDFLNTIENLNSEEIDERLTYFLANNLKDINIKEKDLYDTLSYNENCNKEHLNILASKDLSRLSIQGIINNRFVDLETIELAIKNSSSKELYKLILNEMPDIIEEDEPKLVIIKLNKEALTKLINTAPKFSKEKEQLLCYLMFKNNLNKEDIDFILDEMKNNKIEMDPLYSNELLSQSEITTEQVKRISKFEKFPNTVTFEYCLENNIYTENEIMEIFLESQKRSNEIEMIIIDNKNTSESILRKIYDYVDKYSQEEINCKLNNKEIER